MSGGDVKPILSGSVQFAQMGRIIKHSLNAVYDIFNPGHMTKYILERQFEHYLPEIDLFHNINETEEFPDYTVCYVAGALCRILMHWYEKGMDLSVDQVTAITVQMITGENLSKLI